MNILFTSETTIGTAFLTYQFKVALILICFFLFYRLLMSKETFHKLNRCLLTSMLMVSFILPFCVFTIHRYVPEDVLAATMTDESAIASTPMAEMPEFPVLMNVEGQPVMTETPVAQVDQPAKV